MTHTPIEIAQNLCPFMDSVGDMYDLPLQNDHEHADRARDEFFARSQIGNYLSRMFYVNSDVILSRTEGVEATPEEKAGAASLYDKYHDFLVNALANPDRPGLVVTQEHLDDAAFALSGLKVNMTTEEANAGDSLYNEMLKPTLGMNNQQIIQYMNDTNRFRRLWDIVAAVPTLQAVGPIEGADGPR
ncbi:hypothetical protein LY12_003501 [Prauserella alba]|nr:hypothetical protein [Prauserella alba]